MVRLALQQPKPSDTFALAWSSLRFPPEVITLASR